MVNGTLLCDNTYLLEDEVICNEAHWDEIDSVYGDQFWCVEYSKELDCFVTVCY